MHLAHSMRKASPREWGPKLPWKKVVCTSYWQWWWKSPSLGILSQKNATESPTPIHSLGRRAFSGHQAWCLVCPEGRLPKLECDWLCTSSSLIGSAEIKESCRSLETWKLGRARSLCCLGSNKSLFACRHIPPKRSQDSPRLSRYAMISCLNKVSSHQRGAP